VDLQNICLGPEVRPRRCCRALHPRSFEGPATGWNPRGFFRIQSQAEAFGSGLKRDNVGSDIVQGIENGDQIGMHDRRMHNTNNGVIGRVRVDTL